MLSTQIYRMQQQQGGPVELLVSCDSTQLYVAAQWIRSATCWEMLARVILFILAYMARILSMHSTP